MAVKNAVSRKGGSGRALAAGKFLGPAAVLDGEDAAAYEALRKKFVEHVKPQDIFEELYVRDILDLQWEVMRWRRLNVAQMNVERRRATCDLLLPLLTSMEAGQLYDDCCRQDPERIEEFNKHCEVLGISQDRIDAKLLATQLDRVERVDRMVAMAETRRARMIEDLARHRESFAGLLKGAIEAVETGESVKTVKAVKTGETAETVRTAETIEDVEYEEVGPAGKDDAGPEDGKVEAARAAQQ